MKRIQGVGGEYQINKIFCIVMAASIAVTMAGCSSAQGAEADASDDKSDVETEEETATEEETSSFADIERAEWTTEQMEVLSEIVSGITDREYEIGEGANYLIYEDIAYDRRIVSSVIFGTVQVRFDVPGEYPMVYWIYFDVESLNEWFAENGMDEIYDGMDADADTLAVAVYAAVKITEPEEEAAEETAEDPSVKENASEKPAGFASGSSSSSASSGESSKQYNGLENDFKADAEDAYDCNVSGHDWIATEYPAEGFYEDVMVSESYDYILCKSCGFVSYDTSQQEISSHASSEHGGKSGWIVKTVPATYNQVWHETKAAYTTYECSYCGAVK